MKRTNLPFAAACAAFLALGMSGTSAQITLADTDNAAPVIKGAEDRKIYCGERTIWISDDDLSEVTVNDVPVTLSSDGALTIKPSSEIQLITATDNAGNTTSIKIVVNDGHMDTNGICTVCGLTNLDNIIMTSANKDQIFGKNISRDSIKGVQIFNILSVADESAWDVSENQKGGVKAWITTDDAGSNYLNLAADGNIIANEMSAQLFAYYSNLEFIEGLEYFNTGNVTDMGYMFWECANLKNLNVETFNTRNVTRMSYMFYDCENLQELNVTNFDTSNVTTMAFMFGKCESLNELDVNNFDTSQVNDMYCMFLNCVNLPELDLNNFDTANVTNMSSMFLGCKSLQSLNVDNFDTSKVTDMYCTFSGCENLQSLNVSSFDTGNVTNMKQTFSGCKNLQELNIDNFNTSNVTDMSFMFAGCSSLQTLDVSEFDTSKVRDMSHMFSNCSNVQELKVDNFDISNVTDMTNMFLGCTNLKNTNLDRFNNN